MVDQISIEVKNKRFILDIGAEVWVTDGYDEEDAPVESMYVSRFIFDLIIEALKRKEFIKIDEKE
ncbi:MAG: hypothetical protein J6K39_04070 [Clostridia bacterium]|nr:hypothetical protein [Clostridia bacterium]